MSDSLVIQEPGGTITVPAAALAQVVRGAAGQAHGARVRRPRRGLEIEVEGRSARVSVELAVRYGAVLPEVAEDVQRRVAEGLRTMCGLEPRSIDVTIEELDA